LPELPEVETVRRGLEQKLNNFIIKRVEVCRDSTVAFPKNKEDLKVEDDDQSSALGSMGLKPKIVH